MSQGSNSSQQLVDTLNNINATLHSINAHQAIQLVTPQQSPGGGNQNFFGSPQQGGIPYNQGFGAYVAAMKQQGISPNIINQVTNNFAAATNAQAQAQQAQAANNLPWALPVPSWKDKNYGPLGKELGGAIGSTRIGDMGSHVFGAIGEFGNLLGGPAGKLIGTVATMGQYFTKSIEVLRHWNDSLLRTDLSFAEFSASMSRVAAQQRVYDINLSHERGERRAHSAEFLAHSRNQLERTITPAEDTAAKTKDYAAGIINNIIAGMWQATGNQLAFAVIDQIIDKVAEFFEGHKEPAKSLDDLQKLIEDRQKQWQNYGVPKNMRQS